MKLKTIIFTLEWIKGGKQFKTEPFPKNELNLDNGTQLKATDNYPWFGLNEGDTFQIFWDGKYVRAGGLDWPIGQLIDEIKAGCWSL